jgi:hypothetical protein
MDKVSRIFDICFLVDVLFSSLTTPNVFIVMVEKLDKNIEIGNKE